jgi:phage baseplate assembly protein W
MIPFGDLSLLWGTDLEVGPTGDLALATATQAGQQRVLRRLLTNSGDYIWQPGYGAGLASFIGSPASEPQITAAIRGQIFLETTIATTPAPAIDITANLSGQFNAIAVSIQYTEANHGQIQNVNFTIG